MAAERSPDELAALLRLFLRIMDGSDEQWPGGPVSELLGQVADLLDPPDGGRHVIELRDGSGWSVQHPWACRPDLLGCDVTRAAAARWNTAEGTAGFKGRWVAEMEDGVLLLGERVGS